MDTRRMVQVGFLSAIGFVLMFLLEFPLLPSAPFLQYDPSEVPALIAAFAWGPWTGVVVEVIKNLMFFASGKAVSGVVGFIGALVAGATYVFIAGSIYKHWRTRTGAVVSLFAGSLALVIAMTITNYFILLPMWGIPTEQVGGLIVSAVIPFNAIKGLLSGVVSFLIYKRVRSFIGEDVADNLEVQDSK